MLINVAVFIIGILILHHCIITSLPLWNCDKDVKIQLFKKLKKTIMSRRFRTTFNIQNCSDPRQVKTNYKLWHLEAQTTRDNFKTTAIYQYIYGVF